MKDYSKQLTTFYLNNPHYIESCSIVRKMVNKGRILLVGGQVFRALIYLIYGYDFVRKFDYDFLVETPKNIDSLSDFEVWDLQKTGFGEPRFVKEDSQIDIFGFNNSINPKDRGKLNAMSSEDKINSYFSKVPLNIQAIGFDIDKNRIVGEVGLNAILNKRISVNCLTEAILYSSRHNMSVEEFLKTKVVYPGFEIT